MIEDRDKINIKDINNISNIEKIIKIKKVQDFAIHFDIIKDIANENNYGSDNSYDKNISHYIIISECSYGDYFIKLYKKEYIVDDRHKKGDYYELTYLGRSRYIKDDIIIDERGNKLPTIFSSSDAQARNIFIKDKYSAKYNSRRGNGKFNKTLVYKFIDKEYFVNMLLKYGFAKIEK